MSRIITLDRVKPAIVLPAAPATDLYKGSAWTRHRPALVAVSGAVNQAFGHWLPSAMDSERARVLVYAFGLQESRFVHRWQVVNPARPELKGPARSFWQFERGGGCKGVVTHPASRYWMSEACAGRGVPFNATAIWNAIEQDDVLAAIAARLLIFTDPKRLPEVGDVRGAWNLYMRVWRPGKPHRDTWDELYGVAVRFVTAGG